MAATDESRAIEERRGSRPGRPVGGLLEGGIDPERPGLPQPRAPRVGAQLARQVKRQLASLACERPRQRGEDVWQLGVEPRQPRSAVGLDEMRRRLADEVEGPEASRSWTASEPRALGEPLQRVLAHGLEHQQPVATTDQQLLGHERSQGVQRRAGHPSAAATVAPPAKTAKRANVSRSLIAEQPEAPVDRRAQRAVALRGVACPAGQHRERLVQARRELGRRQQPDPRGGELQRQRQAVEPRQISPTCGALTSSRAKPGSRARARSTNIDTAP